MKAIDIHWPREGDEANANTQAPHDNLYHITYEALKSVCRSIPSLLPLLSARVLAGKAMRKEEEGSPRAIGRGQ
jgi:hypothetical protein